MSVSLPISIVDLAISVGGCSFMKYLLRRMHIERNGCVPWSFHFAFDTTVRIEATTRRKDTSTGTSLILDWTWDKKQKLKLKNCTQST
jgi:hypothetical protein